MLVVAHQPWSSPLRRPRMSNSVDRRPGVSLTSRYLLRDGKPVIPVSGELHYSRVPRSRWVSRLRQMRAGGVTVVASYVFWLHHAPVFGAPSFADNLDVASFVRTCRSEGLDVVLRIGPWVHGESRNGGFPDWVQASPVRHRTDDPAYLALVEEWFGQLGSQVAGLELLGIQLENELYDQPGHLVTLKRLARDAGMSAPIWTATAWGGADLPAEEVLPLYGGYGDGFWVDADAPWDPTFRDHYFFSHVWDDPGIGADLRRPSLGAPQPRTPSPWFPPATCELGGGMATAYHRRPRPSALDVATVAHCKIGNGSAWQGYYMYAGGTNPFAGAQESHATGYPNDMPALGYDFHAPIGEAGLLAPSSAELRHQHAFLASFGAALADMPSTLPEVRPSGVEDSSTMRFALRGNGTSGFLFLAWHQPHHPLPTYRGAQFQVGSLVLPASPVDIPPGTLARWPLRHGPLDWATASALTVLPGDTPTLVLQETAGVPFSYSAGGTVATASPSLSPIHLDGLDLLVLPAALSDAVWVNGDRLLLSADELRWGPDGRVEALTTAAHPSVRVYDPVEGAFATLPLQPSGGVALSVPSTPSLVRDPSTTVPVAYEKFDGRQSAPTPAVFDELAAVYRLDVPSTPGADLFLRIAWSGDVAELRVNGRPVTDRFWDGSPWLINLPDLGWHPGAALTLHVLPLAAGSTVALPRDARDRLLTAEGQLLSIDEVTLFSRSTWHE
ncbi:beta-galactosidase [Paractinoplanes atraurantiacus]|uniref:Glycosyl hydrolases family 35 n=1 Tax=Paractinoplanes atraurantiacus TaxID=1036182 RepID=A0A285J1M8_9ACTN|nr:beta-galactosidase [Actinoplanes atraurantiacus]SNY54164.1 Glycosyl hydrolases family 35 [Actinoplanes atraurantiacus]